MNALVVRSKGGDQYAVQVRGHALIVDQPASAGGTDSGPTPVELLVASLTSCVAHYAGGFLARHQVSRDGLQVDATWQMSHDRPARVASITLQITPPRATPPGRLPALLAVARACTVHNSLERAPDLSIEITGVKVDARLASGQLARPGEERPGLVGAADGLRAPSAGESEPSVDQGCRPVPSWEWHSASLHAGACLAQKGGVRSSPIWRADFESFDPGQERTTGSRSCRDQDS